MLVLVLSNDHNSFSNDYSPNNAAPNNDYDDAAANDDYDHYNDYDYDYDDYDDAAANDYDNNTTANDNDYDDAAANDDYDHYNDDNYSCAVCFCGTAKIKPTKFFRTL